MPWCVCAIIGFRHHGFLAEALEQSIACALLSIGFQQEKLFEPMCFKDGAGVLIEFL